MSKIQTNACVRQEIYFLAQAEHTLTIAILNRILRVIGVFSIIRAGLDVSSGNGGGTGTTALFAVGIASIVLSLIVTIFDKRTSSLSEK
jgi:hypothetical protein